jgi:hypothetical protein
MLVLALGILPSSSGSKAPSPPPTSAPVCMLIISKLNLDSAPTKSRNEKFSSMTLASKSRCISACTLSESTSSISGCAACFLDRCCCYCCYCCCCCPSVCILPHLIGVPEAALKAWSKWGSTARGKHIICILKRLGHGEPARTQCAREEERRSDECAQRAKLRRLSPADPPPPRAYATRQALRRRAGESGFGERREKRVARCWERETTRCAGAVKNFEPAEDVAKQRVGEVCCQEEGERRE